MPKPISVKRKRVGRPATGTEQLYGVRIAEVLMKQIMDWAKAEGATRSEAIRRLVELGLVATSKSRPSERLHAARAADLAAKTIEKISDPAAPSEERAQRRRRLTKGPPEFREHRVDLPKAKGSPK